jgi:hypothetical protein
VDVVYSRCAGLDLHKKTVVACVIVPGPKGKPHKTIRTFGTMTDELSALGDWLAAGEVTHVAMESTGVYWQPLWNLLEERFVLVLVNAHHIKQVPGRKTDVGDCEWIADLLRHGLLKGSFVPDRAQRELRELTRYRTALLQERAAEINRLQKTLEGGNIKLAAVASDVLGKSGRQILEALVAGGGAGAVGQRADARQDPAAGAGAGGYLPPTSAMTSLLPRPGRCRRRSAVLVGHTSRTSAPAVVRASASLRPRLLLPSIAQVAFGVNSAAQRSNVFRLLADMAPFQLPSTPPRASNATALSTCLCGSTPTIAAICWPPRWDTQIERHM